MSKQRGPEVRVAVVQLDDEIALGGGGVTAGLHPAAFRIVGVAEQLGWDITSKNVKSVMVNKNDVKTLSADTPLREIQQLLIEDDGVAGFPVLRTDGSVEGYITRTDLLRQQHYYKSLHYHNKGFSDNLKDRQKWLRLRQKLKAFDME